MQARLKEKKAKSLRLKIGNEAIAVKEKMEKKKITRFRKDKKQKMNNNFPLEKSEKVMRTTANKMVVLIKIIL